MQRRTVLKTLLGGMVALFTGFGVRLGLAAERLDSETLKKRLQTRTKEHEAFIEKIVKLVADKRLSEKSLHGAYSLAMKYRSNRFAYFSAAIKKLAKTEGITL